MLILIGMNLSSLFDNTEKFVVFSSIARRNFSFERLILKWTLFRVLFSLSALIRVDKSVFKTSFCGFCGAVYKVL